MEFETFYVDTEKAGGTGSRNPVEIAKTISGIHARAAERGGRIISQLVIPGKPGSGEDRRAYLTAAIPETDEERRTLSFEPIHAIATES